MVGVARFASGRSIVAIGIKYEKKLTCEGDGSAG